MIDFKENEIHYINNDDDNSDEVRLIFMLKGELKVMNRSKSEILTQTLARLTSTYNKVNKARTRKDKKSNDNTINNNTATLLFNDIILDTTSMTISDMKTGMKIALNENTFELKVIVNPPFIKSMSIFPRTNMRSGCLIVPIIHTLNATNIFYTWSYENKANGLGNKSN